VLYRIPYLRSQEAVGDPTIAPAQEDREGKEGEGDKPQPSAATSEQEARQLAERLHGEVEAGGELVYEAAPQNPFAIFGGLGGSGTPL